MKDPCDIAVQVQELHDKASRLELLAREIVATLCVERNFSSTIGDLHKPIPNGDHPLRPMMEVWRDKLAVATGTA